MDIGKSIWDPRTAGFVIVLCYFMGSNAFVPVVELQDAQQAIAGVPVRAEWA